VTRARVRMDPAALRDFEQTCAVAMGPAAVDPAQRAAAQAQLHQLGASLDFIPTIQGVLDASTSDLAMMAAAISLHTLITEHWNAFSEAQRLEIRACPRKRGRARRGMGGERRRGGRRGRGASRASRRPPFPPLRPRSRMHPLPLLLPSPAQATTC
jgi:hypothetical protein